MIPTLAPSYAHLEQQRSLLLTQIEALPASRLALHSSPAEWSSLDVLDHVVRVETAGLGAIRAALPARNPVSLQDAIRARLICSVMQSPMRVRVPATATEVIPDQTSDLPAILAHWSTTRANLEELLTSLTPDQLRIGLFRHPVSGWMNAARTLAFLSAHLRHHRYQLDRIRRALPTA